VARLAHHRLAPHLVDAEHQLRVVVVRPILSHVILLAVRF
jgi:hypothetical protein